MFRPLAFAMGLALCVFSGWQPADASAMKIAKRAATSKVIVYESTALAAKALKSLKEIKHRHWEHVTNKVHPGQGTLAYTIKGWKLVLHEPVQFSLPLRGSFERAEIDLRKPALFAGGYACSQVESCVAFVKKVCDSVPNSKCDSVADTRKVEIGD